MGRRLPAPRRHSTEHHEGASRRDGTATEAEARQILAKSAADLYGADLDFLQTIADRVGPTVEEIATPLQPDEIPDDPNFHMIIGAHGNVFEAQGTKR